MNIFAIVKQIGKTHFLHNVDKHSLYVIKRLLYKVCICILLGDPLNFEVRSMEVQTRELITLHLL